MGALSLSLSLSLSFFFLPFLFFLEKIGVPTTLVSRQQGLPWKSRKSLLLRRWVGLSVGNAFVRQSTCRTLLAYLALFGVYRRFLLFCSCPLPNYLVGLFHHRPCPPAHDLGSRVRCIRPCSFNIR